jgi:hypothetical protein
MLELLQVEPFMLSFARKCKNIVEVTDSDKQQKNCYIFLYLNARADLNPLPLIAKCSIGYAHVANL